MKFVKETTSKGLQIPTAAMKLSGFESSGKVELHASEDTLVVLKQRMTAMELLRAARSLQKLATDLHVHLARVCGHCDGCDGECPFGGGDEVELPDYLREEAGIPEKAKLCASVDEDEHTVTISEADYDYDLRDVPEEVLEMFRGRRDLCRRIGGAADSGRRSVWRLRHISIPIPQMRLGNGGNWRSGGPATRPIFPVSGPLRRASARTSMGCT